MVSFFLWILGLVLGVFSALNLRKFNDSSEKYEKKKKYLIRFFILMLLSIFFVVMSSLSEKDTASCMFSCDAQRKLSSQFSTTD